MNLKKERYDTADPPRRRRDVRTSTGEVVRINERDLQWAEILHRHGPQTTHMLHLFTQDRWRNELMAERRAKKLYHEDQTRIEAEGTWQPLGGPFFSRPIWQFATRGADGNDIINDLTETSKTALHLTRRWREHTPPTSSYPIHDYLGAHSVASIHLGTLAYPAYRAKKLEQGIELEIVAIRLIFGDEIRAEAAGSSSCEITIIHPLTKEKYVTHLIPDNLFALEYTFVNGHKEYLALIVEVGKGSEPRRTYNFDRKGELRSFLVYEQYHERGLYKKHLGLDCGALVLNILTSRLIMDTIIEVGMERAAARNHQGISYQCYQYVGGFLNDRAFKPPKEPFFHLLYEPWQRPGYPPINLLNPNAQV